MEVSPRSKEASSKPFLADEIQTNRNLKTVLLILTHLSSLVYRAKWMEVRRKEGNDIQIVVKSKNLFIQAISHARANSFSHRQNNDDDDTPRGFFSARWEAFSFQFIVRKIRHFVSCEGRESIFYVNRVVVFLFCISEAFPFSFPRFA